jgi:hypothetical protein
MSNTMFRRKRLESLEIVFVETHGDLFCARRANRDIEIFKISCELLDTVTCPERTLLFVSAETRALPLPFCRRHLPAPLAISPSAIAPHLVCIGHPSADA